jgi:formate hydrogenlyase subunit 4
MMLLANAFYPFGLAIDASPAGIVFACVTLLAKLLLLSILIVLVETANAKMRLFRVPELLAVAFILGALALISTFLF